MLSVGFLGGRGYIGSSLLPPLLNASKKGLLKLIILHRESSDISAYPKNVEKRELDLEGDDATLGRTLGDLNIVVSAISGRNIRSQASIIRSLVGSNNLITFIPSDFATPLTSEDLSTPFLSWSNEKTKLLNLAKELGVPVTVVKAATTPEILFAFKGSGLNVKENKLELYTPSDGKHTRGLSSEAYLGAAFLQLLLNHTNSLPNNSFSLVEILFSANDMKEALEKIYGTPPEVQDYTEADYQNDVRDSLFPAMGAAGKKWLSVGVDWPGEIIKVANWKGKGLEGYIRDFI